MNVKTNFRKIGLSAVGTALLLAAAAVVWSQQPQGPRPRGDFQGGPPPPGGMGMRGPGGPGPRQGFGPFGPFTRELNLTDDQRAQVQKIQESFRESDRALLDQLRTLHENQGDPLAGEFNEGAVRSAAEARAKIQVELEVAHARMMSQMLAVLTTEQRAQLKAHHDQMRQMGPPQPPQPPAEPPF